MAIIVCPECGSKISDTVNQCIHCGSKIKICPECGKIYTKDVVSCEECGFAFSGSAWIQNKTRSFKPEEEKIKTTKELYDKWEKSSPLNTLYSNNWITIGMYVAAVLFAVIAVVKIFTSGTDAVPSTKTLLVFTLIFYILPCAYSNFGEYYKILSIKNFCIKHNTDTTLLIQEALAWDYDSMPLTTAVEKAGSAQWCIYAQSYQDNIILRTSVPKYAAVKTALSALTAIFLLVFCFQNVETYMSDSSFELSMLKSWWLLIAAAVSVVAGHYFAKISDLKTEGACLDWVKKNAPDGVAAFEKCVCGEGMAEYIVKRSEESDN